MWYPSHFIVIPLSYLVILLLAAYTRRLSKKSRLRILRILFMAVICSECLKQAYGLRNGCYSTAYLPFHYSTTYYVSLGLCAFGNERQRHYAQCSLLVGGVLLLITMTCSPFSVVGDCAFIFTEWPALHSLLYHCVTLFALAMMLACGAYHPQRYDSLRYLSFLYTWATIAVPAAYVTQTNYAGLLESYLPFLEKLRLAYGNLAYLVAYMLLVSALAVLILQIHAWILRRATAQKHAGTEKEPMA